MPTEVVNQLLMEEARHVAGLTQPWQLLDFFGVVLGGYFVWEGWKRNGINVGLGVMMMYIHSRRFFPAESVIV